MLAAMSERSFVVTIAYIKTEPVQVALFGLDLPRRRGDAADGGRDPDRHRRRRRHVAQARRDRWRPAARRCSGSPPARMFALSAIGYPRRDPQPRHCRAIVMAATFTLVVGLVHADACCCRSISCCATARCCARSCAPGGRRCSPASWARSPRSSGSSPSRSPPPRACARSRWSRCCSRRRSRAFVFKQHDHARARLLGDLC